MASETNDNNGKPCDQSRESDAKELMDMLGEPVDISGIDDETDINKIDAKSFELYKETISLVRVCFSILDEESHSKGGFARNHAICVGLLVRISKFMTAVIQLSASTDRREVVQALSRSIMESATNVEFLAQATDDKYFNQYVEYSLAPERELYDTIQENIKKADGQVLPIETRMLESIDHVCRASAMKIEDVNKKHREWGESMRKRLEAIGKDGGYYVALQRVPSHAVHGSWVDLQMNNLEFNEEKNVFTPRPEWGGVDSRMFGPIATVVLDAINVYLKRFLSHVPVGGLIWERHVNLRERIMIVDAAHEARKQLEV
jgi:hypothetical protein